MQQNRINYILASAFPRYNLQRFLARAATTNRYCMEDFVPEIRQRLVITIALAASVLLLSGCPPRTKISDIERDPGKYANKDVTVAGSGTMWVYSQNFGVPGNGSKVAVTGRISQGFSFGGRSFAIILRETQPRH